MLSVFGTNVQSSRSYLAITSAIVIAGVLISASLFVAIGGAKTTTVTKTITITSTATCAEGGSNATSAFATDCTLGITLGLAGIQIVAFGQNNTLHVSLTNDQAAPRNVNYTGFPALPHGFDPATSGSFDYVLPLQPSCGYPSTAGFEPAFVVVFNGSGSPLQMSDSPLSVVNCISSAKNYHTFNASQTIREAISIGGYWTSTNPSEPWINATYHQFSVGNYTVVAFDPWNQVAQFGFVVDFSDSYSYLTASGTCSGPGGYTACWGSQDAYVFGCGSAAATSQGCTQKVTSTVPPFPSYTINIRYPFTNQTEPSWANCLWTVAGVTPGQGYAYCISVSSSSFVIGMQAPSHL